VARVLTDEDIIHRKFRRELPVSEAPRRADGIMIRIFTSGKWEGSDYETTPLHVLP
jgi:hypothetical protein